MLEKEKIQEVLDFSRPGTERTFHVALNQREILIFCTVSVIRNHTHFLQLYKLYLYVFL
jgi:hypothetical protein